MPNDFADNNLLEVTIDEFGAMQESFDFFDLETFGNNIYTQGDESQECSLEQIIKVYREMVYIQQYSIDLQVIDGNFWVRADIKKFAKPWESF